VYEKRYDVMSLERTQIQYGISIRSLPVKN
jgi:hypothetical protein